MFPNVQNQLFITNYEYPNTFTAKNAKKLRDKNEELRMAKDRSLSF